MSRAQAIADLVRLSPYMTGAELVEGIGDWPDGDVTMLIVGLAAAVDRDQREAAAIRARGRARELQLQAVRRRRK